MAGSTEVRFSIKYGWAIGDNFKTDMDANLLKIARAGIHLSVKDRNLATPPASPADGDTYIVAAAPTGAWTGYADYVAVWDAAAASWAVFLPRIGWVTYIEDEQVLSAYKATGWSAGIAI